MCAQSHALVTHTKFQPEILTVNVTSGIVYFRKIILESSRNVSETTPRPAIFSLLSVDFSECIMVYSDPREALHAWFMDL